MPPHKDFLDIHVVFPATFMFSFNFRSVSKVHDEWFADEDKVRSAVGLLEKRAVEFPHREVSGAQ